MKKSVIVLWIIGALFLVCSFPLFFKGDIGAGACGIVIAAACAFFGWHKQKKPSPAPTPKNSAPAPSDEYEFINFKVAGVTFRNGHKERQSILRKIYFKDEPFDTGEYELTLSRYEYEGKPAFSVCVDGEQIGNLPADLCDYVSGNFSRIDSFSYFNVYRIGGEGYNFGAECVLRLNK